MNITYHSVATNDCWFYDRKSHEAHDALLCIAEGRYVTEEDRTQGNTGTLF